MTKRKCQYAPSKHFWQQLYYDMSEKADSQSVFCHAYYERLYERLSVCFCQYETDNLENGLIGLCFALCAQSGLENYYLTDCIVAQNQDDFNYVFGFPGGYEVTFEVPSVACCAQGPEDCDEAESLCEDMQAKLKITWVHLIRYNTYLNRLLDMSPLLGRNQFAFRGQVFWSNYVVYQKIFFGIRNDFFLDTIAIVVQLWNQQLHNCIQM